MMKTRRAAMGRAGLGAAVFLSFADILFANPAVSFWERAAAFASLGFFVGILCFSYGESSLKKPLKLRNTNPGAPIASSRKLDAMGSTSGFAEKIGAADETELVDQEALDFRIVE